MDVRSRDDRDLDACVAVAEQVQARDGYPPRRPSDLRSFVTSPDALAVLVAVDGGEVLGQVVLNPTTTREAMEAARKVIGDRPLAVVARLVVAPDRRRQGVGQQLLRAAAAEAWALDRQPILDVATHFHPAISLYEHCGWTRIAEVESFATTLDPLPEYVYLAPPPPRQPT